LVGGGCVVVVVVVVVVLGGVEDKTKRCERAKKRVCVREREREVCAMNEPEKGRYSVGLLYLYGWCRREE